jgi:hypothetical protein
MTKKQKSWVFHPSKPAAPKITTLVQAIVQQRADEFVEKVLKPRHIKTPPPASEVQFNYITDIYAKWHGRYFYFCSKYCVPGPNAIKPFFEDRFARLEYIKDDTFNVAYKRHTGAWFEVYFDLSLEQCLATIENNGLFQP